MAGIRRDSQQIFKMSNIWSANDLRVFLIHFKQAMYCYPACQDKDFLILIDGTKKIRACVANTDKNRRNEEYVRIMMLLRNLLRLYQIRRKKMELVLLAVQPAE